MNRRLLMVLGACVAVLVGLLVVGLLSDKETGLRSIGAPADIGCNEVTDVTPSGASEHVTGQVVYDRIPPSSGKHDPNPAVPVRRRYTTQDTPSVEQLVHNLEHGWVVVWYNPGASDLGDLDKALAAAGERKLVAAPYTRSTLPGMYVYTAWGHEQRCMWASGEALAGFLAAYGGPNSRAPESSAP